MTKILLLTDIPPTSAYTGGIVLEQAFRNLPIDSYYCYAATSYALSPVISEEFKNIRIQFDKKPREYFPIPPMLRKFKKFFYSIVFCYELYYSKVKVKKLEKRILDYCKDKDISTVFCVLQGQTMVRLAEPVSRALNAKLVVMVWDSLDWWLRHHNIDPITTKMLHKQLDRTMKYASSCATASKNMTDYYIKAYGLPSYPVIYSVCENNIFPPTGKTNEEKRFVIGFAGQLYAYNTLVTFIQLLEHVNWVIEGVPVELVVIGEGHEHLAKLYKQIRFIGWRNQDTLISSLSEFDALYLPYIFDLAFKTEMETSFPSKLVTYFAAGKTVFFHGPDYSSVHTLLQKYEAGISCTSTSKASIYHALSRLILDEKLRTRCTQNANAVLREFFTYTAQRELFFKTLGHSPAFTESIAKAA